MKLKNRSFFKAWCRTCSMFTYFATNVTFMIRKPIKNLNNPSLLLYLFTPPLWITIAICSFLAYLASFERKWHKIDSCNNKKKKPFYRYCNNDLKDAKKYKNSISEGGINSIYSGHLRKEALNGPASLNDLSIGG